MTLEAGSLHNNSARADTQKNVARTVSAKMTAERDMQRVWRAGRGGTSSRQQFNLQNRCGVSSDAACHHHISGGWGARRQGNGPEGTAATAAAAAGAGTHPHVLDGR